MHDSLRPAKLLAGFVLLTVSLGANAALVLNPPMAITEMVTVQPIVVSDDGGGNTATFFGTPGQQSTIESLIDSIWAQAGIDVTFLTPNMWNNTFANQGTLNPRPTSDLNTVVANGALAGVTHANPNVVNMFFVNIPAGFGPLSVDSAAGLATVGGNGITQYVGSNLLTFGGGLEVIASVVAHELGHNLGLDHLVEAENLMQASGAANQGERLNAAQISTALASNLSTPVVVIPVPAAAWLLASALVLVPRRARGLTACA